ncbi:MAG: ROK family protein [Phycisphaerae bacterium]
MPEQSLLPSSGSAANAACHLEAGQRRVLRRLWESGPASRIEIARGLHLRPNEVGKLVEVLRGHQLVHEGEPVPSAGGRPRVPLLLDPTTRHVVGVAVAPGEVLAVRLNLLGEAAGKTHRRKVATPGRLVSSAAAALRQVCDDETVAVGVSVTGFVDVEARRLLFSSAMPGARPVSLQPLFDAAPAAVVVQNDMHALAAQWLLSRRVTAEQEALLVKVDDGSVGGALIVNGRPNRGSVLSGNEIGHMRCQAPTPRCYCGHTGCLERVFSTAYYRKLTGRRSATLFAAAEAYDGSDEALNQILSHLARGIANVTNFARPHRLVVVSPLARHRRVMDALLAGVRREVLDVLLDRLTIDQWDHSNSSTAESAGWLALAGLYYGGWQSPDRQEVTSG